MEMIYFSNLNKIGTCLAQMLDTRQGGAHSVKILTLSLIVLIILIKL